MAVRSRLEQQQHVRDKIQTTQLVKRLMLHALKEDGDLMTTSQVNAAKILLNKVIGDQSNITLDAVIDAQVDNNWTVEYINAEAKAK